MTVLPIAIEYSDLYSLSKGVVAETENSIKFKKPVIVNVPMTSLRREASNDTEIIAFKIFEDGRTEYLEDAEITYVNGIVSYQVWGFSLWVILRLIFGWKV